MRRCVRSPMRGFQARALDAPRRRLSPAIVDSSKRLADAPQAAERRVIDPSAPDSRQSVSSDLGNCRKSGTTSFRHAQFEQLF